MSALQRRCWVAARIEGVMVAGTCCRGQRRSRVLRAAGSGGIVGGVESLDAVQVSVTMRIEVPWEMKNTALEWRCLAVPIPR